ncbi:MAG: M14 family zinc carboxypeptidase [Alphaproteobacteria bacterium]|jgi:hypothetical protein
MIRILEDHTGTRIGSARVDGAHVAVDMRHEPMTRADWTTHDYNVHFCVGLENAGPADTEIELSVEGGRWDDLPDRTPLLYAANDAAGPFAPATFPARTDLRRRYVARIPLAAGARVYVANTLVRDLSLLSADFDKIASAGGAERRVIGHSLEDRELVAYLYGDPAKGTLLVSSGFHPPEPDTLATAEIMRYLASAEGQALAARLAVAILPITNPDGYADGTQGSNAADINFYWHFARELPQRCPEAAALWRFAESLAPRAYIDFHCYTFQLGKQAGPYLRPSFFHDGAPVRTACEALYRRLQEDVPGRPVTGFGTYAPHTLGAMLNARFDTISLAKYHLHLAEGEAGCRDRGKRVFRAMAETLLAHGLAGPAPGKGAAWRAPLCQALIWWAGLLRPTIGKLRRGQFGQVRMDRTALVPAEDGLAD